ncbi:MAG TPA: Nif3-like dinuclear metal center hexameric protein [Opitutales bacterium]|jgi:dinuclear metal center YbgI/SA1388 family protein|nr:Nif3-like dinuclear metal center hexameric protein [Opitutales bacterium]
MPSLDQVVAFCDRRVRVRDIADFPGALNGLQAANSGRVSKIGASVDAGLGSFALAAAVGVDFLIVHHGMFWDGAQPITGSNHARLKVLLEADCAVYSAHLPLDAHPQIGNNALIARALGLKITEWGIHYQGTPIAAFVAKSPSRAVLKTKLKKLFPRGITPIEFGPAQPRKVAILSGSGSSCVGRLREEGVDTLITGELKQSAFNAAQEAGLNLFICGHYATEVFGACALAQECADRFRVKWEFLDTGCPL